MPKPDMDEYWRLKHQGEHDKAAQGVSDTFKNALIFVGGASIAIGAVVAMEYLRFRKKAPISRG